MNKCSGNVSCLDDRDNPMTEVAVDMVPERPPEEFGRPQKLGRPEESEGVMSSDILSQLEYEYLRFNSLKTLKKNFLKYSGIDQSYEANKVWANWIIVNRVESSQIDPFLPTEGIQLDNKTVSLLIEKGCREQDAIGFYAGFIQQCQRWKHRFRYYSIGSQGPMPHVKLPPGLEGAIAQQHKGGIKITTNQMPHKRDQKDWYPHLPGTESESQTNNQFVPPMTKGEPGVEHERAMTHTIEYRGIHHTLEHEQFISLLGQYAGSHPYFDLWKMLNHYFLLDGLSYQWSLPPRTFEVLRTRLGVRTELFASPLNHHLDDYYSLFPDNDRLFGSRGDFFQSSWDNFRAGGIYEANPPFIESIFVKTSQIILHYLDKAVEESVSLSFIFIMPNWLDSFGYQRLKDSKYLLKELILKKYNHSYWEYRKDKYITAHFDSHVLFLTSNSNEFEPIWTSSVEKEFTSTFALEC